MERTITLSFMNLLDLQDGINEKIIRLKKMVTMAENYQDEDAKEQFLKSLKRYEDLKEFFTNEIQK